MKRRSFLETAAAGMAAALAERLSLAKAAGMWLDGKVSASLTELQTGFISPPALAQPWVYWFVEDGNLTKEGITADFEAMHRVGIRGVLYMEVDLNIPAGPVRFASPAWREMIKWANTEATRLGITIDMNDCAGWCASAGPWITPDNSHQMVVWTESHHQGGKQITAALDKPLTKLDFYKEIAVLAFPTPVAASTRMADKSPTFSYGSNRTPVDGAKLIDGSISAAISIPAEANDQFQYLNIDFEQPFTAQAFSLAPSDAPGGRGNNTAFDGVIEVSEDGQQYQPLASATFRMLITSVNFSRTSSRHFRIGLRALRRGRGGGPAAAANILIAEAELHGDNRIEDVAGKAFYTRQDPPVLEDGSISQDSTIPRSAIVDISKHMDAQGNLTWQAPSGNNWTVMRFGFTTTGVENHPAPQEGLGLDCDKLSKRGAEANFAGLMQKLVDDQKSICGKALTLTHIDSWETGTQNWTTGFEAMFHEKTGYDILPYLPVFSGRVVESKDISERFLWDLRRTVADLLLENYAATMRKLANDAGLELSIEAYGSGPLDELAYAGEADRPMSEFWTGQTPNNWNKEMPSSAHVYGKQICGAEAFTAGAANAKWTNHPAQLKSLGDHAFTLGVNHFVFHRYSAQPWVNLTGPCMTMGQFGINMERTNTWWEQSRDWLTYLARCMYILQAGVFVADIAYLGSENVPAPFPEIEKLSPIIPLGYDYDFVAQQAVVKMMTVKNGRLVLPSGMSYRVLVLPESDTMRPELLSKVKALVMDGAVVIGPPPKASPSLVNYPACDQQIAQLATDLWGGTNGSGITERRLGKGRVIWNISTADVLVDLGITPDFNVHGWPDFTNVAVGSQVRYIHRRIDDDDIYFVASTSSTPTRQLCTFRVNGKRPELWWPDSGKIEYIATYDEDATGVRVPLEFEPSGSVFVVFRGNSSTSPERIVSIRRNNVEISGLLTTPPVGPQLDQPGVRLTTRADGSGYTIETEHSGVYELRTDTGRILQATAVTQPKPRELVGPWQLNFPKGLRAPDQITLPQLISWTDHADEGVKYFSGTATYRHRFTVPATGPSRRLYLDLGKVEVIAQVKLNGKDLGLLWKPPYRVDITDAVRVGINELEVQVVNLWPNRLIGDEQLPPDVEWKPTTANGAAIAKIPDFVLKNQPSPTGRVAFTTWKLWTKDDPLLPSGLLGPVHIISVAEIKVS